MWQQKLENFIMGETGNHIPPENQMKGFPVQIVQVLRGTPLALQYVSHNLR